jgi:nuclear RNA export factor
MPPARRAGGIRKRQQERRDRDGDLVMGAVPRATTAPKPQSSNSSRSLVELKVTGWTDETEVPKITKFLERHASKRNAAAKSGGMSSNLIRRSRALGETLTISVRADDVPAFSKINGFSFPSAHGQQKLTITGAGVREKPVNGAEATNSETKSHIEMLKGFLERRYNPEQKLLNLSSITDDDQGMICYILTGY